MKRLLLLLFLGLSLTFFSRAETESPRRAQRLDEGWRSVAADTGETRYTGFEAPGFDDRCWAQVSVPHNWDDYGGLTLVPHGNRHGTAWYRRSFGLPKQEQGRRVFLFFEGVASYATVWVNGKLAGKHAGGRTTFTLDVTDLVRYGDDNLLAVKAEHPASIADLPWVCGGCSEAAGFSEGSQPFGLFRPVQVITTGDARVEPFGVHVWNDADASAERALVHVETELRNYASERTLEVRTRLLDPLGKLVAERSAKPLVAPGAQTLRGDFPLTGVTLWAPETPALYSLETSLWAEGRELDRTSTTFGIRTIQWPSPEAPLPAPFRVNGKPVFLNGTCEYEHLLGGSHAFGDEQIRARVAQVRAAGFNAFRDAHQPHNLRYQEYWDRDGILWWPQFAAQIWYDTPEFRANFKALLRDWVRERRNSPSLVLWGLANESKLPADFAAECVELIRSLDPTTSSQRLVTTCNSGKGTDWNVPQNWSGTYGGSPDDYAKDLRRQRLVGEYGAWRSLGLHSEGGFQADGPRSEDRAAALLETKLRLAESVRGEIPGHFHWLLVTHENPGRTIGSKGQQGSDGWAALDRLGPANNKGLFTLWGEPTDLYYLFRAAYAPADKDPMVYIVSHTWPDRWNEPGKKSGLLVYSNADEVELFNGVGERSLGLRKREGFGPSFRWDDVEIATNVLYAEARKGGRVVARDFVVLGKLPAAPRLASLAGPVADLTAPAPGWNYLYRVNCGGPAVTDTHGQNWSADRDFAQGASWGSLSWAAEYPTLPPRFGSQRLSSELIRGTQDGALFQSYRYGREKLRYRFAVPASGNYRVELYFSELWYGAGGGDCRGWRLFDVAVNGDTVLRDVDLWAEAGFAGAVKKTVRASARDGWLEISFPRVAVGEALVCAIAVASDDPRATAPADAVVSAPSGNAVPQAQVPKPAQRETSETSYPVSAAKKTGATLIWHIELGLGGGHEYRLRYRNLGAKPVSAELQVLAVDGSVAGKQTLKLKPTKSGSIARSPAANLGMNAGDYRVVVTLPEDPDIQVEALLVQ